MHELHRPAIIDALGHSQWFGLCPEQTFFGFDSSVLLQLPVDSINPFMTPVEAFDVAQIRITQTKSRVTRAMR